MKKIIIVSTEDYPTAESENGFNRIDIEGYNQQIWRRDISNYIIFISPCIARERESVLIKQAHIAELVNAIKGTIGTNEEYEMYLIAHDADLLPFEIKESGSAQELNRVYHNEELEDNSALKGQLVDKHVYIFQHSRSSVALMYKQFVMLMLEPVFSEKNIEAAISLFDNEA